MPDMDSVDTTYCEFRIGGKPLKLRLSAADCGLMECRMVARRERSEAPVRNPHLQQAVEQLHRYCDDSNAPLDVIIAPQGTDFFMQVWQAARSIARGSTVAYSDLAREIGHPDASRAVGIALNRNPLLLFVPCHRIVAKDGSLGGFGCGLEWKRVLLRHEGVCLAEQTSLGLDK